MKGSTIHEIIKVITKTYNEEKEIKEITIEANPFSIKNKRKIKKKIQKIKNKK
jgi:coproporphyrinogen III oxidase-like Fe-S oxidoreductase